MDTVQVAAAPRNSAAFEYTRKLLFKKWVIHKQMQADCGFHCIDLKMSRGVAATSLNELLYMLHLSIVSDQLWVFAESLWLS